MKQMHLLVEIFGIFELLNVDIFSGKFSGDFGFFCVLANRFRPQTLPAGFNTKIASLKADAICVNHFRGAVAAIIGPSHL